MAYDVHCHSPEPGGLLGTHYRIRTVEAAIMMHVQPAEGDFDPRLVAGYAVTYRDYDELFRLFSDEMLTPGACAIIHLIALDDPIFYAMREQRGSARGNWRIASMPNLIFWMEWAETARKYLQDPANGNMTEISFPLTHEAASPYV